MSPNVIGSGGSPISPDVCRTRRTAPAAAGLAVLVGTALAGGCARQATRPAAAAPRITVVAEAFESARFSADNIDSLAVWAPGGWLLATAKSTNAVLVFDASDGRLLQRIPAGTQGTGQFRRPNGIAVVDDLLLVVERDRHRVQVIKLPDLTTLGHIGEGALRFPYGIAAFASASGRYEVFVTDSYQLPDSTVPPDAQLGERVRHFRLDPVNGELGASLVRSFGATSGAGVLHVVESIAADPINNRLLIADEVAGVHDIKVYDLDGHFTGVSLGRGVFQAEPEGISLFERGKDGYWVATDQQKNRTVFYLFDRTTLKPLGSFAGHIVANTDGIVVASTALAGFPGGVLFAVHNDVSVAAFSWPAIAAALALPQ